MTSQSTTRRAGLARLGMTVAAAALLVSVCGLALGSFNARQFTRATVTSRRVTHLTLWENYGTEANATATRSLVKAFEKLHRNITISVVAQPADNYFALLQAAAVSKTGPDLAVMWTGLFTLQYKSYLQNLKSYVPKKDLNRMLGMRWVAPGFNTAEGAYVIPLEDQFYIGFYNKSVFQQAGVSQVPATWAALYADCAKFKAIGKNCLFYGADTQALGAEFYPYYDLSYLMIGALSVSEWEQLYSGKLKWTSPQVEAQLAEWAKLHADGYTNTSVISSSDSLIALEQGKTAMIVDGNWDLATLYQSMGSSLGTFVPPYSNGGIHGVVQYPGDGFSMTTYSQHKAQAAEFLQFLTTTKAANIVNNSGLIPDVKGVSTTNPVSQDMLNFAAKDKFSVYPMLDNVTQVGVVNAGSKVLPELLAGEISVSGAAQALQQAWTQLPKGERGATWASYHS
ncbi:MAG: ABC transporter substrate-binding protein [Candidatus Dormibacteria bacterium]